MARYHHHYRYQKTYKGYSDLRDLLEDKHQREGTSVGNVPEDPPSLLKDPLRGDAPQENPRVPRNESHRGRGYYQRRPFNYNQRSRGNYHYRPRGRGSVPSNPRNIKVELSTESGDRKYSIEPDNDISDRFANRGRGYHNPNYRGRWVRWNRRGRGNRGGFNNYDNSNRKPRDFQQAEAKGEENWDLKTSGNTEGVNEARSDGNKDFKEVSKGYGDYDEVKDYGNKDFKEVSKGYDDYAEVKDDGNKDFKEVSKGCGDYDAVKDYGNEDFKEVSKGYDYAEVKGDGNEDFKEVSKGYDDYAEVEGEYYEETEGYYYRPQGDVENLKNVEDAVIPETEIDDTLKDDHKRTSTNVPESNSGTLRTNTEQSCFENKSEEKSEASNNTVKNIDIIIGNKISEEQTSENTEKIVAVKSDDEEKSESKSDEKSEASNNTVKNIDINIDVNKKFEEQTSEIKSEAKSAASNISEGTEKSEVVKSDNNETSENKSDEKSITTDVLENTDEVETLNSDTNKKIEKQTLQMKPGNCDAENIIEEANN